MRVIRCHIYPPPTVAFQAEKTFVTLPQKQPEAIITFLASDTTIVVVFFLLVRILVSFHGVLCIKMDRVTTDGTRKLH